MKKIKYYLRRPHQMIDPVPEPKRFFILFGIYTVFNLIFASHVFWFFGFNILIILWRVAYIKGYLDS